MHVITKSKQTDLEHVCISSSIQMLYMRPKKKKCYVALSRPTVKCEKNRVGFFFFFFFMSDLGEEFAKICIQWLKKALAWLVYICVLTAFRPSFPHLETLKKLLENSTLSRYVKKKKKIPTDRPNFQILVGWGQHKHFFFWPNDAPHSTPGYCIVWRHLASARGKIM